MYGFERPQCSLKLGPRYAAWVEQSRDWRGRRRCRYRLADLPQDLLRPSPVEPNISDPAALEARLRALIGPEKKGAKSIVLVLPDLCVRATLLELDALPPRPSERDALIRWRLGQESAFPLAGTKVVAQPLSPKAVLAVAIREAVLGQYEAVCEAVGLYPVDINVASFFLWSAHIDAVSPAEPFAWLSLLDDGFTCAVHHEGRPVFLRTKNQSGTGREGVFQDLTRSLAFCADTCPQVSPRRLVMVGEEPDADLERRVTDELGLDVIRVSGGNLRLPGWAPHDGAVPVGALPAVAGLFARRSARRREGPSGASAQINLSSTRSYVGPLRAGLMLLSLLFMGLISWDLLQAKAIEPRIAEAERAVARVRDQDSRLRLQAQADGLDLSDAALQRLPQEVAFANQVITKRVFSWTRFLTDLEEAVPPRVAIQSIRLDFKDSAIALGGSALTLKDLTALIIGLEDHRAFAQAVLVQHRVKDNGLVEFGLTVRYTP